MMQVFKEYINEQKEERELIDVMKKSTKKQNYRIMKMGYAKI